MTICKTKEEFEKWGKEEKKFESIFTFETHEIGEIIESSPAVFEDEDGRRWKIIRRRILGVDEDELDEETKLWIQMRPKQTYRYKTCLVNIKEDGT